MNKPNENLKCIFVKTIVSSSLILKAVSKLVTRLTQIRDVNNKKKISELLENTDYFKRLIHDPEERKQLLEHARQYMKYKFFPKGTLIHDSKEIISSFSIIVIGKAIAFIPKKSEIMKKEYNDFRKSQVIQEYVLYITNEKLDEKLKGWLTKKEVGTKALRKRLDMLSVKNDDNQNKDTELNDFSLMVEKVLEDKSSVLPIHLRDFDLSFGEKLLLLSHFGQPGEYIKNGVFTILANKELKASDTFGEVSLLKPTAMDYTIVAAEDVHLVSFTRDDYRILYSLEIPNIQNKIQFLIKIFNETSTASLIKIAYFLEERVLIGREVLYKEGEESNAIYFIKKGEIQLVLQKQKLPKVASLQDIRSKSQENSKTKQKMIVGNLQAGAMFGEEDVIERQVRKYTAISTNPQTILYVLRSDIFNNIFDKHLPHLTTVFKDWMNVKSIWRKQRTQAEQELASELNPTKINSNDPYSLIDTENKRQPSQEPKKFYSPRKDIYTEPGVDSENGLTQERITFKVIPNQPPLSLVPVSPQKQIPLENRLFERQINTSINKGSQSIIKSKEIKTPRKESQSSKQYTLDSFTPSINELITPRSFDNKIVKSKTLNNELVSPRPKLSTKPKTLVTLESDTYEPNNHIPGYSILNSVKSNRSHNMENRLNSPLVSSITKSGVIDSLKSIDAPKLSKESFKLLKRITSTQVKDNNATNNEENQQFTEYGIQIPDHFYLNKGNNNTKYRNNFKGNLSTRKSKENSIDDKVEYYRPHDSVKSEYSLFKMKGGSNFRIKKLSQSQFLANRHKDWEKLNPVSINNLELKL